MHIVSLARSAPPSVDSWELIVELPPTLLDAAKTPAVFISRGAVRVERADGFADTVALPTDSAQMDNVQAQCRLYRRRRQLVVTWPVPKVVESEDVEKELPAPPEDRPVTEALKLRWWRHQKLWRMRGEKPLGFAEWRNRFSRRSPSGALLELDPLGRGLWSNTSTSMDDAFEKEASQVDSPPDLELPRLAAPRLLSALASAPRTRTEDVSEWARSALRAELMKACATDRCAPEARDGKRIDTFVHAAKVGAGSAGVVTDAGRFLCGYSFQVETSFVIKFAENSGIGLCLDARFEGSIVIPDCESDLSEDALVLQMQTVMKDPQPQDDNMDSLLPTLSRLKASLSYFVRRFERCFFLAQAAQHSNTQ